MPGAPHRALEPNPDASIEHPRRKLRRGHAPAPSRRLGEPREPSSINALLREHHHTRLYVSPLHWTATQLQLLECQLTLLPSGDSAESDATGVLAAEGAASRSDSTMEVHLFALASDSRAFYFYTARVPLAFLRRLERPSRHFPGGGFRVQYHRVSLTSPDKVRSIGSALAAIHGG